MTIYRTVDSEYTTLVAHGHELNDGEYGYAGLFEYSVRFEPTDGEWVLSIFDLGENEILDVDTLVGVDSRAIAGLVAASRGDGELVEIKGSDYYSRLEAYDTVLRDPVLFEGIVNEAHYSEDN